MSGAHGNKTVVAEPPTWEPVGLPDVPVSLSAHDWRQSAPRDVLLSLNSPM
jgi:hypothetical protein